MKLKTSKANEAKKIKERSKKADEKQKTIKVLRDPSREEIDVPVEEQLIVEYYSK